MDLVSSLVLLVAVVAFFVGIAMLVVNLTAAGAGRASVARGINSIDAVYGSASDPTAKVGESALARAHDRISRIGRATTPQSFLSTLRRRLDLAGNPPFWTVERVFEVKGLALIALGLLGATVGYFTNGPFGVVLGAGLGAVAGFFVPDLIVYEISERRQERIRDTLPDMLDTLTVSVEAGLGFDAALNQLTRYGRGPLAGEFARVLQEMQIGRSRIDAMRALGQRTKIVELRSFCALVVQATELGVPIANVLREQSREMRTRRRQRAEEKAQKVPIKILFPLIFCLFPAIFIVVLGPGVLNIMDTFGR